MKPTVLDAIDVTEKVDLRFPFASEMNVGETISSVVITCAVKSGVDATPVNTLVNAALISASTSEVVQRVQGRLAPVTYKFKCIATLSSGRVLTRLAELPVLNF